MSHVSPGLRLLLAALVAAPAPGALALGLGEAELRSALGEPLDLVIHLTAGPDESLGAECFYLPRPLPGSLPAVSRAQFSIEAGPKLRVRTPQPLDEPAMVLRMHASCPGGGLVAREYPLLLDPRPVSAPVAPVAQATAPPAPKSAASKPSADPGAPALRTLAGDSLSGIASAIYPRDRRAREAYIAAMREANPSLADVGADEPLPPDTSLALPDLRALSRRVAPGPAARPAPARPEEAAAPRRAKRERAPEQAAPAPRKPAAPKTRESPKRADGFVLRLSSAEVDLGRSKDIDDSTRARLRERLMLLDADDQVSALLQLRNSLRQLENRVSEMQLRMSGTLPPPARAPEAGAAGAPGSAPVAVPAAPAAPPSSVTPEPKPAEAPPAAPAPPAPAAARKPSPTPAKPESVAAAFGWQPWALGALAIAGLAIFLLLLRRRRARSAEIASDGAYGFAAARTPASEPPVAQRYHDPDGLLEEAASPHEAAAAPATDQTMRLEGQDPGALRRRYLEERFPEIANGALDLGDPDSVVKGARLFYEDGALPRAVELLQLALEERPDEPKPWLALFEIFRLENLAGEFGALAARFRERHGTSDNWRKVQYIGRELDPQNPLYRDDAFDSLETIGYPNAAKSRAIVFDPLAENWLNAPMDFTSDALAAELRAALLADAGLAESDLIPNPMPALKQVEMFTVA